MQESWVGSLGGEDLLEKGMVTYSSILIWRIPWTEEPGGLQSMGSQRIGHDRVTFTFGAGLGFPGGSVIKNPPAKAGDVGSVPGVGRSPGERKWQPTPVFLPGEIPWTEEPDRLQFMGSQKSWM